MVPSLTETLIECGVNVVGRTKFCIHPEERVGNIPRVGGTKQLNWQRCLEQKPDLVIFDREENLKEMADACPVPWHATHIKSIHGIGTELRELAHRLDCAELFNVADRWEELSTRPRLESVDWSNVPGQLETLNNAQNAYTRIEYMIWRDPWMAVNSRTFIGSMLEKIGFADLLGEHSVPYPQLQDSQVGEPNTFYLFSSEPYPFLNEQKTLKESGINGAIVDGEVYSWFGIRSLRALSKFL